MKSQPRSPLEVIEAELFLLLLIGLLADPVGLDGAGQLPERCADGQIAEVAFALAGGAVLADQPHLVAGKMLLAEITDPRRRAACHPTVRSRRTASGDRRLQGAQSDRHGHAAVAACAAPPRRTPAGQVNGP